ncbi:hypothetical protein [Caulobacter mirabilis]|uniref:Lipoprotein n=1 Tax=Caulobacter mirabilis TaxID=69666 RepID=A0A2D2AVJ9_9CAUL|nr:hypothetical protein [Caulobacter mirabilis]ATQ42039.1 hypothetical protein CSW64_06225 [Caulobacter mirabilis]
MRSLLIACLGLSLAACNMVVTETPMFTAADQTGATPREGIWLSADADCAVDVAKKADAWPECADWFVYRQGRMEFPNEKPDLPFSGPVPVVVAGGSPQVWQMTLELPAKAGEPKSRMSLYAGFEPLERDGQGRVTRYRSWPALCGPPPPPEEEKKAAAAAPPAPRSGKASDKNVPGASGEASADELKLPDLMTKAPFPGLTLMGKAGCKPDDEAALRNAVAASRAFAEEHEEIRWVRERYP